MNNLILNAEKLTERIREEIDYFMGSLPKIIATAFVIGHVNGLEIQVSITRDEDEMIDDGSGHYACLGLDTGGEA